MVFDAAPRTGGASVGAPSAASPGFIDGLRVDGAMERVTGYALDNCMSGGLDEGG